jgi:hypothetical protein
MCKVPLNTYYPSSPLEAFFVFFFFFSNLVKLVMLQLGFRIVNHMLK